MTKGSDTSFSTVFSTNDTYYIPFFYWLMFFDTVKPNLVKFEDM